jgi:anti-sigma-K factor RskA
MNADEKQTKDFEERASALLGESVTRVNARVRSRLNQARHAALEEMTANAGRRAWWRAPVFMPATGAVAAAVLVLLIVTSHQRGGGALPVLEASGQPVDDIEMLADSDGLDLLENWDGGFYEWAASESEGGSDGTSG